MVAPPAIFQPSPSAAAAQRKPQLASGRVSSFKDQVWALLLFLIAFVCLTVVAIVALPLLVAAYVVTRLIQFIYGCGHVYDKGTQLKDVVKVKVFIQTWILLDATYLLLFLIPVYTVGRTVPRMGLGYITILRYPVMEWIENYFIIYGVYSVTYFVSIACIKLVMYSMPLDYSSFKSGSYVVPDTVREIIDCFIFLLFAEHLVVEHAYFLKGYEILGFYPVYRLFRVLVLLLVCHDLIGLSTHVFVWHLHKLVNNPGSDINSIRNVIATRFLGRKSLVYWANGLKPSIMFTFTSLMLLFVWVFHFGDMLKEHEYGHGTNEAAKKILRIGTWSSLCLFIFSIVWLIKAYILLVLEDRIVYKRFGSTIPYRGIQLYFLGVIGRIKHDFLKLRYDSNFSLNQHNDSSINDCLRHLKETKLKDYCSNFFKKPGIRSLLMISIYPVLSIDDTALYHREKDLVDGLYDPKEKKFTVKKLSEEWKKRVKKDLLRKKGDISSVSTTPRLREMQKQQEGISTSTTLYELQKKVQYFLDAEKTLSQDKYISDILQSLRDLDQCNDRERLEPVEKISETLRNLIICGNDENDDDDWRAFYDDLLHYNSEILPDKDNKKQFPSSSSETITAEPQLNEITYEHLRTWLERAHNRCMIMANTLSSAKKIVECLDRILSIILLVVALLLWLLLTGLTTKDIIIIVGSPLIALSFVFGETPSTFFQGIVFVYAVHPFEVGDLCTIDNVLYEVITIGVWKTTFSKVETQETVIVPNSELSTKNIINHKTKLDLTEYVEIYVDSLDNNKIDELKQKIQDELEKGKIYETKPGYIVKLMATEENKIKIGVTFRYKETLLKEGMYSHFECLKEKQKFRSEFIQKIVAEDKNNKINEQPMFQDGEIQQDVEIQ